MRASPLDDAARATAHRKARWQAVLGPLLVTVVSVFTVLGAIVLSLQGQFQSVQPVVNEPENSVVEMIPTAPIATLPPGIFATIASVTPEWNALAATACPDGACPEPTATATAEAAVTPLEATAAGPAATPWPCNPPPPRNWVLYVVQRGDTLFSLALRHGTTQHDVIAYNCLTSTGLRSGQRLYLPEIVTAAPTQTATATATSTPSVTVTVTATPVFTATTTLTPVPTTAPPPASPTATPSLSPTASAPPPTEVITPTETPRSTAPSSGTPEASPTASATPSGTATSAPTLTPGDLSTAVPTATARPTAEPELRPSPPPADTATAPPPTAQPGATLSPIPVLRILVAVLRVATGSGYWVRGL